MTILFLLTQLHGLVWSGDQPAAHAVVLLSRGAPAPIDSGIPLGTPPSDPGGKPPSREAPRLAPLGSPITAHLDEVWLSFVPKVQVVPPGSTLIFTAKDADSHTVHAWYGKQTLFNRASVPHGPLQSAVLDRPGVVAVTCDLHQEMRAWVLVDDSALSAVSDAEGKFTVAAPAGPQQVRVWQPGDEAPHDLGERLLEDGMQLRIPPRVAPVKAAAPALASAPPRTTHRLPGWMLELGARRSWPEGKADYALSIVGVPVGFGLVWLLFLLGARRRWTMATCVLFGCGLAFSLGALSMAGLSAAVATGLGFGAFIGTVIVGAQKL